MGRLQFATVDDACAGQWLRWLCHELPKDARLFPGSEQRLRDAFAKLPRLAGLSHLAFTLGSLRAGGAAAAYNEHRNIPSLRFQGRWVGDSSFEPYLQEATASLVEAELGPGEELIDAMLHLALVFDHPPSLPWIAFFAPRGQVAMLSCWRRKELSAAQAKLGRYGISLAAAS